ncbi:hypothetical protein HFP72_21805 [Nocardiopsis sp. ARC36]
MLATRPVIEGKRLTELLISQARFLAEARVYTRLAPEYEPSEVRVAVRVWHRDPEAGPLAVPRRRRAGRRAVEAAPAAVPAEETTAVRPVPAAAPPLPGLAERVSASAPAVEEAPAPAAAGRGSGGGDREPVRVSAAPLLPASAVSAPAAPSRAAFPGERTAPERTGESGNAGAPAREERVPVAVASLARPGDRAPEDDRGEEFHASEASAGSHGDPGTPDGPDGPRRGVGRRVLNYFGWGLRPERPAAPEEAGSGDDGERDAFDEEPVHRTENDEQRDSDAWFANLRASSGETPVGLTSKNAYSLGDTGALSRDEVADAVAGNRGPGRERRRAEEVMSAPTPNRRTTPPPRGACAAAPRASGSRRTWRSAAPSRCANGAPRSSAPSGPRESASPKRGPHPPPAKRTGPPRGPGFRAAGDARTPPRGTWTRSGPRRAPPTTRTCPTTRSASRPPPVGPPQRPPCRGCPRPPPPRRRRTAWTPGRHRDTGPVRLPARTRGPPATPPRTPRNPGLRPPPPRSPRPRRPRSRGSRRRPGARAPGASRNGARGRRRGRRRGGPHRGRGPAPELDHGTGEQDAMPRRPEEEPEDRGPEWDAHMSVLDRHLITADTPAPPRPKFADAVPTTERDAPRDPGEWFEDGKKRHPDQPKVGDRGNPVIPAGELREDGAAVSGPADDPGAEAARTEAAEPVRRAPEPEEAETAGPTEAVPEPDAPEEGAKPPTQLDHGTGELVSFAEVRDEPGRADRNVRADPGTGTARRRTVSDLEEAEAAALARRRAAAVRDAGRGEDGRADGVRPAGTRSEIARSEAAGSGAEAAAEAAPQTRWTMRATGAAEDVPPAREDTSAPDQRDAPADADGHESAARDPRGNPSMADALAAEGPGSEDLWSRETGEPGSTGTAAPADAAREAGDGAGAPDTGQDPARTRSPRTAPTPVTASSTGLPRTPASSASSSGSPSRATSPSRPPGTPGPAGTRPRHGRAGEPGRHAQRRPVAAAPALRARQGAGRGTPRRAGRQRVRRHPGLATPRQGRHRRGGARPLGPAPSDIERLRTPLEGPRSLVVLGCTGGAGQTVTTLMIGHTLAAHRDDLVVAVDVNPGPNGLSRRVGAQTPETLTALLANADAIGDYARMSGYTSRSGTGLEVVQTLDDPYVQTLDDRDYGQLASLLGSFYGITLLDPAATGVARALPVADGLVLVAPANADAERAVSMTFDWLDGNGYNALRANSVLVVNGVSKRSLKDVDAAERVARGRCRAIVRIPWDDHLGSSYTRIDVGALRPATKRAHGALGGVLVNALVR